MDDEHFLERLERLDDPQVGDALALYYDPQLVRELLDYARARGTSERAAISIDHPRDGPFIIVTQGGDFVTTLARGMSPEPWPIVPRSAWEAIRRESARTRELWATARELGKGQIAELARRFRDRGPRVSLEVMLGLRAIVSLLEDDFIRSYRADVVRVSRQTEAARQRATWRRLDDGLFHELGVAMWRASHTLVLMAASDIKKRGPDDPFISLIQTSRPSFLFGRVGLWGPLLRAIWAAGKLGHLLFPTYKADFRREATTLGMHEVAAGIATIGARFSRYRGEAKKALTIAEHLDASPLERFRSKTGAAYRFLLEKNVEAGVVREVARQFGEEQWYAALADGSPNDGPRGALPLVEPSLALPAVAASSKSLIDDSRGEFDLAMVAPMLGYLDLEDLYYPEAIAGALEPVDLAREVRPFFEFLRSTVVRHNNKPARAAVTPGRNEPCPCGSGKKYKRCCGA